MNNVPAKLVLGYIVELFIVNIVVSRASKLFLILVRYNMRLCGRTVQSPCLLAGLVSIWATLSRDRVVNRMYNVSSLVSPRSLV